VDVAFQSIAEVYGANAIGVLMTGMGRDGVDGCRAIRAAGGYVLGQDEASSEFYGMNRLAWQEGQVDEQFSLADAATVIAATVKRRAPQELAAT
jgi:two-component system chemotaxis response regulator CheB